MTTGKVEALFIGPVQEGAMSAVEALRAVSGQGVEGDRYWQASTPSSRKKGPDREITLIEAEAIEGLESAGIALDPSESRRNVVTRGIALNDLVGREFRVGEASLRGIRLCDPCGHLEELTGRRGLKKGLDNRGGLRAQVIADGTIRVGDAVVS